MATRCGVAGSGATSWRPALSAAQAMDAGSADGIWYGVDLTLESPLPRGSASVGEGWRLRAASLRLRYCSGYRFLHPSDPTARFSLASLVPHCLFLLVADPSSGTGIAVQNAIRFQLDIVREATVPKSQATTLLPSLTFQAFRPRPAPSVGKSGIESMAVVSNQPHQKEACGLQAVSALGPSSIAPL